MLLLIYQICVFSLHFQLLSFFDLVYIIELKKTIFRILIILIIMNMMIRFRCYLFAARHPPLFVVISVINKLGFNSENAFKVISFVIAIPNFLGNREKVSSQLFSRVQALGCQQFTTQVPKVKNVMLQGAEVVDLVTLNAK